MPRPQFRLRSLFILTAMVAVAVWAWKPMLYVLIVGIGITVHLFLFLGPAIALTWFVSWTEDRHRKYRPAKRHTRAATSQASPPTE